jgi:hypothetical protein
VKVSLERQVIARSGVDFPFVVSIELYIEHGESEMFCPAIPILMPGASKLRNPG